LTHRTVVLIVTLLGIAVLPSCTIYMWNEDFGWWLVSRREYQSIDAASLDTDGNLYAHLLRLHADAELWVTRLPSTPEGQGGMLKAQATADRPLPPSCKVIRILDHEAAVSMLFEKGPMPTDAFAGADYIVYLHCDREHAWVGVVDVRSPDQTLRFPLSKQDIAWFTPNAMGHVVLTPLTAAIDIAFLPIYAIAGVLVLTGVVHTH
jgi:hypothetical protein